MSIKVSGLSEVLRNIQNIKAAQIASEVVSETSLRVQMSAKQLSPVDTGRMRASIEIVKAMPTLHFVIVDVDYAKYVEFGTYKQRAQPYLRPALEMHRAFFHQRFKQKLK